MHHQSIEQWKHSHQFNTDKDEARQKTLVVVILTAITMVVEIIAGWIFQSMALFADGCHMSTHTAALLISWVAYILAQRQSSNNQFTFGSWKIEILGAYTSAILLAIVAIYVIIVSIKRIWNPSAIDYNNALLVAVIGMVVNLLSAFILHSSHHSHEEHEHEYHEHGHEYEHEEHEHEHEEHGHEHHEHEEHEHEHEDEDLNLKSAYLHVVADGFTSILAILALLGAKYFQWNLLDPAMGIVGGFLIARWSVILLRETCTILLDKQIHPEINQTIQKLLESDGDTKITDMHIWKVAQTKYACIISLVASHVYQPEYYKEKIIRNHIADFAHITIETQLCDSVRHSVNPCKNLDKLLKP